jgi:hypothetical protein
MLAQETETKPSDFKGIEIPLQDPREEIVARTIVLILTKKKNEWSGFDWIEYYRLSPRVISEEELLILNNLVEKEFLSWENGVFSVREKFLKLLERART